MKKALIITAALCFGASSAYACEFQRSAKASQTTDPTVVASVVLPQSEPVPTADTVAPIAEVPAE